MALCGKLGREMHGFRVKQRQCFRASAPDTCTQPSKL